MGWVTINGNHVFIEDAPASAYGGGNEGSHDPATSTGHAQVDAILKSRLQPAIKTPSGKIKIGERGQYHWEIAGSGKTVEEVAKYPYGMKEGFQRGFVDPLGRKYYDAQKLGLDASEIGTRKPWLR